MRARRLPGTRPPGPTRSLELLNFPGGQRENLGLTDGVAVLQLNHGAPQIQHLGLRAPVSLMTDNADLFASDEAVDE